MTNYDTLITDAKNSNATAARNACALACLDLTTLNDTDTEDDVRIICQKAITPKGNVAAICINPEYVDFAKRTLLDPSVKIATVANFPSGNDSQEQVIADIKKAIFDGADEIDVVLPYTDYLNGNKEKAMALIKAAKQTCGDKILKVILETGALKDGATIKSASEDCLNAGADFLKTSTGKIEVGATLEAAAIMLNAIKDYQETNPRILGFKASGGVRTPDDAAHYIQLANAIMGNAWATPETFRIGASSLLDKLL